MDGGCQSVTDRKEHVKIIRDDDAFKTSLRERIWNNNDHAVAMRDPITVALPGICDGVRKVVLFRSCIVNR